MINDFNLLIQLPKTYSLISVQSKELKLESKLEKYDFHKNIFCWTEQESQLLLMGLLPKGFKTISTSDDNRVAFFTVNNLITPGSTQHKLQFLSVLDHFSLHTKSTWHSDHIYCWWWFITHHHQLNQNSSWTSLLALKEVK